MKSKNWLILIIVVITLVGDFHLCINYGTFHYELDYDGLVWKYLEYKNNIK